MACRRTLLLPWRAQRPLPPVLPSRPGRLQPWRQVLPPLTLPRASPWQRAWAFQQFLPERRLRAPMPRPSTRRALRQPVLRRRSSPWPEWPLQPASVLRPLPWPGRLRSWLWASRPQALKLLAWVQPVLLQLASALRPLPWPERLRSWLQASRLLVWMRQASLRFSEPAWRLACSMGPRALARRQPLPASEPLPWQVPAWTRRPWLRVWFRACSYRLAWRPPLWLRSLPCLPCRSI